MMSARVVRRAAELYCAVSVVATHRSWTVYASIHETVVANYE